MKNKLKVGIVGGSGYTAAELLALLPLHPKLELQWVYSHSHAGEAVSSAHPHLTDNKHYFTDSIQTDVDAVFLCLGHGISQQFLQQNHFAKHTKIIDLGNDFRAMHQKEVNNRNVVYGLSEVFSDLIAKSSFVANPGCFATAIQLALAPLANAQLLTNAVHISAITGSSGAGKGLSATSHFSWRNNNISWYKPFKHQHLAEIEQTIQCLQNSVPDIFFIPFRGNFTRGIYASCYTKINLPLNKVKQMYAKYYQGQPFVKIFEQPIDLKLVVNTNNCLLHLHFDNDTLLITAALDNLIKGAGGQAIQNLNTMMHWETNLGLQLKPTIF